MAQEKGLMLFLLAPKVEGLELTPKTLVNAWPPVHFPAVGCMVPVVEQVVVVTGPLVVLSLPEVAPMPTPDLVLGKYLTVGATSPTRQGRWATWTTAAPRTGL